MHPIVLIKAAVTGLGRIAKSYLTGPDGESWSPGRLFALATFTIAQCLVVRASAAMMPKIVSAEGWQTFFIGVGGFQAVTAATCVALVLGNAPADPGGAWWRAKGPEQPGNEPPPG